MSWKFSTSKFSERSLLYSLYFKLQGVRDLFYVDVQVIKKIGINHRIVIDFELRPSLSNWHHTSKHGEPSLPVKEMQ